MPLSFACYGHKQLKLWMVDIKHDALVTDLRILAKPEFLMRHMPTVSIKLGVGSSTLLRRRRTFLFLVPMFPMRSPRPLLRNRVST